LIGTLFILSLVGLVFYLATTDNTFLGGFLAATITWKWKDWVFNPIDNFLEKHWPFSQ
jgi:hypothetical protein